MAPAKPKIIAVLGPTASGKSDLAVTLAKKFGGEIISADSRQVYRGMDIGTGKITTQEMAGIKHYLLDVASPKKIFTAADYKGLAEKAIGKILAKGKTPIICGGTGFYIHALLSGLKIPEVPPDWKLRKKLEEKTAERLFAILKKLDPGRAKNIDQKNPRRLIRAIEIAKALGPARNASKLACVAGGQNQKYKILWLGVRKPDKELKKLIKKRLLKRLKMGMINEVRKLHASGVSWKRLDGFGLEYRYVSRYLRGKISKEEMTEQLNNAINQFAKRQMTWFKKYAPKTHWLETKKRGLPADRQAFRLVEKFLSK